MAIQSVTSPTIRISNTPETELPTNVQTKPLPGEKITCQGPQDSFETAPSGVVKQGDQTYHIDNGTVRLNGKDIGQIDDSGNYSVTINGVGLSGNVADLVGANYEGTLSSGQPVSNRPTGQVGVSGETYDVKNGDVKLHGQQVGTINDQGEFDVQGQQGRVQDLDGARYQGTLSDGQAVASHASGEVQVGDTTYEVRNGQVFLNGANIGEIGNDGRYDVTIDGRSYEGQVTDLEGVRITGRAADGSIISYSGANTTPVREPDVRLIKQFEP